MLMYSTFLHEPQLIGFAYALEQALNARRQPQFLGAITPIPNAGLCSTPHQPKAKRTCRTAGSSSSDIFSLEHASRMITLLA
jgi:hypothetical protein